MNDSKTSSAPASRRRISRRALVVAAVLLVVLSGVFAYFRHYVISGGLRARQHPGALESYVMTELVKLSIPEEATGMKNPLNTRPDSGDVEAGRALYVKDCTVC